MRQVSERLAQILDDGSFAASLSVDVFYGAERTLQDLAVAPSWQLKWTKSAEVPGAGRVLVQYDSEAGESLTPREFTDRLAPFGQAAAPKILIRADRFEEQVQVGRWRITDVPTARDDTLSTPARVITTGSFVELDLMDPLEGVRASEFTRPEQPPSNATAWSELQRLTGMKIVRSVGDVAVPSSVTYEMSDGGRMKAVRELASALGGSAYVTSDGALTVLPDVLGPVRGRFTVGDDAKILRLEHGMSSQGIYNEVVGLFEDDNRNTIRSVAQVTDGPLSVRGEFGRRTRYYSSPLVKTQSGADSAVRKILAQSVAAKSFRIPVDARLDPRYEVGDTVQLERPTETFTGQIAEIVFRADGTMQMQVDVAARVPERNL